MFNFENFYESLSQIGLGKWNQAFEKTIKKKLEKPDGHFPQWLKAVSALPNIATEDGVFVEDNGCVTAKALKEPSQEELDDMKSALLQLSPWRKGPFNLCGLHLDAEWRGEIKWSYIADKISSLKNKVVLDLGCNNGYYMFRMAEQEPKMVIGIDPSKLCWMQFKGLQKYLKYLNIFYLPVGIEDMPENCEIFDSLFAMGILYHRKDPFEFLRKLKFLLKKGGELIFETMTVEGDENTVLVPRNRYSGMKNVWFFPSDKALMVWLEKAGFNNIKLIYKYKTSVDEQRKTSWMTGETLADWLDPMDSNRTIEGLPAPIRSIITCQR